MPPYSRLVITAAISALVSAVQVRAASETEILEAIGDLRNIQPVDDAKGLASINARMDAAWSRIEADKIRAVPLVLRELQRELAAGIPDQFFLLDMAHLAVKLGGKDAEPIARQVLVRIDPATKIIQYNDQELFYFTYELAKSGGPDVRAQIDRLFLPLRKGRQIFIPAHYFTITPTLMNVFLYGITGPDAEDHVADLLAKYPAQRNQLMEILFYLGTERSVERVRQTLIAYGDYDTVTHAIAILMTVGGPKGRDVVLNLDPVNFDPEAKKYYQQIRPNVSKHDFKTQAKALDQYQGSITKLSDEKLKQRLALMYDKYGVEDELSPSVILKAELPKDYLIEQMMRIRSRTFFRLNQHALDDVSVTNQIINALQFRE